ncbi:MAG: branched-chain amino acid ABC transporter permease [Actinobacteria bacterium 13_2_20CM_2_71_6]|nr:MAG: branched-chain amino acid ABC transporter permease [Actinobacteria bacterium 13_2_20CM_2_71_6]
MNQFLQATLYGLLQGGLLALVAVGFSLVWGVMNVVNLAHGAFVLGGAYLAFELNSWLGLDPFVGMLPAAVVLFGVGYVLQRFLVNLVVNAPIFITLLLTFGLQLLAVNGMILLFTANYRSIPTGYAGDPLPLPGDVRVPAGRLIAALLAVGITIGLGYVMRRTRIGLSILATGMDRGAARLMGIKAAHVYALTFGIAAGLAGAAGAATGAVTTFRLLPGTLVNALAFAVLVIVLAARPQGLAGRAFYAARVEV